MNPSDPGSPWLPWLLCPACRRELQWLTVDKRSQNGKVMEGILQCQFCCQKYPITGGILRLLKRPSNWEVHKTVEKFSFAWRQASKNLDSTPFLDPKLFLDFLQPIGQEFFQNKVILDLGCGMGRFSQLALDFGAKFVIGIDLGNAIEVAAQRLGDDPRLLLIQADGLNLPVGPFVDYAFSIGVLHHTENPERAFQNLVTTVRLGGSVSIWVYGRENNEWILKWVDPIRKGLTSALPNWALNALSYGIGLALYVILVTIYLPVSNLPWLGWLGGKLFQYEYLVHLGRLGLKTVIQVVLDHLAPYHAYYLPRSDVEKWYKDAQMQDISITSRTQNSWRGFGTKPLTVAANG